jgi:hypothetical protein
LAVERKKGVFCEQGAWLPDGIFLNKTSKFGETLEGLAMEYVDTFYVHLVFFSAIF